MKRFVWVSCCLLLSSCLVWAQKIKISGTVMEGNSRQPAAFANVVLQTDNATFVQGVSADLKGQFQLNKIKEGNYRLVISAVGFTDCVTELKGLSHSIDLGQLVLQESTEQLDEVTVTASNMIQQEERKIVFPNKQQLAASTNGMNLLQALMLPRIEYNPMNRGVSMAGGGTVQLCINGVKCDEKEIATLQPADILRIEYIENPGLRYGNAEAVINYITRRHETGGSLSLDMTNSPHVVFHNDNISGRINYKKSEFGLSYYASPRDFYDCWRSNEERFQFEDGTTLHRYEKGKPGHLQELNQGANLSYNFQEGDRYLLNARLHYKSYQRPHDDYRSELYNVEYPDRVSEMTDLNEEHPRTTSLDLYYQHNLKHKQFLAINLVGTYNGTHTQRIYQERQNGQLLSDIFSKVDGKKYSIIGEGIYEKGFAKGRLSSGLRHMQSYSDNSYAGNLAYQTQMKQAQSYLYSEFKGKWNKLNYSVGIGVTRDWSKQEGQESYETYTFRPRFSLRYAFSDHFYARLNGGMSNYAPALSQLSAVVQLIDSMQIQQGNPGLEPYKSYQTDLYMEYRKGKCSVGFSTRYTHSPKAIMESTFYKEGKFVHTFDNQDGFQHLNSELNLRMGMLWNVLQFSLTGGVNRYWSDGLDYYHNYTNWYYRAEVMGQYRHWMAMFSLYNRRNQFWGEKMTSGENMHMLMVRYNLKQCSFGAGMINPFVNNYKRIYEDRNRYVSSHKELFINESSRAFVLTFSWNFQFGRKYKSGGKMLNNQDRESGVVKAGR